MADADSEREALRDMVRDAILHFESVAEEADRTIRRLRAKLSALEADTPEASMDRYEISSFGQSNETPEGHCATHSVHIIRKS